MRANRTGKTRYTFGMFEFETQGDNPLEEAMPWPG